MSASNAVDRPRYRICSRRHVKMEFPTGQIDVWLKNSNLYDNAAEMPMCLAALLDSFPFEHEPFTTVYSQYWSELEVSDSGMEVTVNETEAPETNYNNLQKIVRKILLRRVIRCPRCKPKFDLVVIRRRSS